MRNVFITTVTAMVITASAALAEDTVTKTQTPMGPVLSGKVEMKFSQDTTTDNWGGAMAVDLGIDPGDMATVDLDFVTEDGSAVDLDSWTVGTSVNGLDIAIGDANGLMPETTADAAANGTLAAPAMTESVAVTMGSASVALGFTDWTTDVTDISNIQGAYTVDAGIASVTASADYNMDSENTVIGGAVSGVDLGLATAGGALTYDTDAEVFGFEGTVGAGGLTAYANGDDTDMLQNLGGEYTYNFAGVDLTGGANYNVDAEEFTPSVTMGFSF